MSSETARRLPGDVLIWTGILGATAMLALRLSAPAPRWDVLACVAVTLVGFAWRARGDRASLAVATAVPYAPAPYPVRYVGLTGRWPIIWRSLLATLTFAATCITVALAVEWAFASADDSRPPDLAKGLLSGVYVVTTFAFWPLVHRGVSEEAGATTATRVLTAVREGAGRQLAVQIVGWGATVHRPHLIDVHDSYAAARSGKRPSKRLVGARIPQLVSSLRLAAAGGERSLFLDGPVDSELLGIALQGRLGLLHWAPSGRFEAAMQGNSAPAILELGDGRYLRGWTEDSSSPRFPQGTSSGVAPASPASARVLRPIEPSILLQRRTYRPLTVLGAVALLCVSVSLLGFADAWEGGAGPLILALLLVTAGLVGDAVSGRVRRKRLMPAAVASVAPPKPAPPAPVGRPGPPSGPPPASAADRYRPN